MEMEKNLASANICSTFSFTYQLDNFCITIKMYSRSRARRSQASRGGREQRYQHLLATQDGGVAMGGGQVSFQDQVMKEIYVFCSDCATIKQNKADKTH